MASKLSTDDILKIQDYAQFSTPELIAMRMKAAETVNRQMRRWEKAGLKDKPSAYTKYAKPYLRKYDRDRFKTSSGPVAGRTDAQIRRAEISELREDLNKRSVTTFTEKL